MAGSIVIGKNPIYDLSKDPLKDELTGESMSSSDAICFGDTIIKVLEQTLPEVIPEITFIYDFANAIDFSSLDKKSFNQTIKTLEKFFENLISSKDDNCDEYTAKAIWNYFLPTIQKDERYSSDFKFEERLF